MNDVLDELGCRDKPTLLVLNKIDALADRSHLHVFEKHHPQSVAVSGLTGEGLDSLTEAVIELLSADFAPAEVVTDAGNGKVIAYLNAHAEIFRQEFRGDDVVIRCHLPRHLLHHIDGPGVAVRFLNGAATQSA